MEMRTMFRCGLSVAATLGVLWCCQEAATAQPASGSRSAAPDRAAGEVRSLAAARGAGSKARRRTAARTPQPVPPLPERKPPSGAPAEAAEPEVWQPNEIAAAQARCAKLLETIDAVVEPQPPIREGECGAAAPIRLIALGKRPQVAFSPPALVNCDMAAALATWIKNDLQPLAARHLGEKIAKVEVMSDYSCRTAFNRPGRKLSQHAFADAVDIRGFVTESGQLAHVIDAWGMTKRDLAAQVAAQMAAANAQADAAGKDTSAPTAGAKPSQNDKPPQKTAEAGNAKRGESLDSTVARLGGPRSGEQQHKNRLPQFAALGPQSLPVPAPGPRTQFLRAAHAAACRIFGTTLGPEANEAHRNHFHVDMAERKYKKICD
jgi:hypothetical protein